MWLENWTKSWNFWCWHGYCWITEIQAAGSTHGNYFRVTTFGESHGGGVGCIIDGCPPRLPLSEADMQVDLDRRYWMLKTQLLLYSLLMNLSPYLYGYIRMICLRCVLEQVVINTGVLISFDETFLFEDWFVGIVVSRRPGQSRITTPRKETDTCRILSGVSEG